jgi:hypothetical protein
MKIDRSFDNGERKPPADFSNRRRERESEAIPTAFEGGVFHLD